MQNQLFEAALGIARPWYVRGIDFDAARKVLTIGIDFASSPDIPTGWIATTSRESSMPH